MIGVENFTQKDPLKHSSKHLSFILRAPDPNGFPIFIFSVEASKKHLSGANNERKRLQEEICSIFVFQPPRRVMGEVLGCLCPLFIWRGAQ